MAPDDEVRPGLPVLPDLFEHLFETIPVRDHVRCGYTALLDAGNETHCPRCDEHTWTRALAERRVT